MKVFTRERIIFAIISTVGVIISAYFTASSSASDAIVEYKLETEKRFGAVEGNVKTLQALNPEINRRLENIEGSLNTITSFLLNK